MKKLKVGLFSAVQPSFWGSGKKQFEKYYALEMQKISEKLGFDLYVFPEPLVGRKDAEKTKLAVKEQEIDFILLQLSTFAGGDVIEPIAELGLPIGLWGIPEITETGAIPLNSFCGINMYASIIGQYIDKSIKIKWFYGDVKDSMFIDRFGITICALTAIKKLRSSKVALVGGIAPGFNNLYFDERKTKSKLGVKVERLHEFAEIKDKALAYTQAEISKVVEEIIAEANCVTVNSKANLEMTARVYKAFEDLILENGYSAIAIGCWPKYRKELGIVACTVIGRLLDKGYIAGCEGDIDSAISMLLLKYISSDMPMLMDLSKLDFNAESVLMWHCGSAPKRHADAQGMCLAGHYKPGSKIPGADDIKVGTVNDMVFKPSPITIARFTWEYEKMLVFSGDMIERDDKSYDGSRGWVSNISMDGENVKLKDFVNTLMVQRYQHHYPIAFGNFENEVREVMAWLDVSPLQTVKYKDYMQNIQG